MGIRQFTYSPDIVIDGWRPLKAAAGDLPRNAMDIFLPSKDSEGCFAVTAIRECRPEISQYM